MKLLMVEDNTRLSAIMARLLRDAGIVVDAVASMEEARGALATGVYNLILLDLGLPDGDGATLLREIRTARDPTPILVATARGDVVERVAMLDAGADDYMVKPFSLDELLARIRALLRRPPLTAESQLVAGNVTLDIVRRTLTVEGAAVEVPRLEFRILAALLGHRDRLLPRARLEQTVYSSDAEVTPNAIEAAISRLRRRLDAHGAELSITAMRGLGYILAVRGPG